MTNRIIKCLGVIVLILSMIDAVIPNITTPFPLINNCTQNIMPTFNKIRKALNAIKSKHLHDATPKRPIDPMCIVPDTKFNNTFMPNFYCPTMQQNLYCNKTQELQFLHNFYNSLNGDHWINNRLWINDSIDYCQWHGIYCCNTSYPLYQTCINIMWLDWNNLTGTLPAPWPNSTVLTVFSVSHNHITGTIPDYHESLPNLSVFAINPEGDPYSVTGSLPKWPKAGCMVLFDTHNNQQLTGTIPEWNEPLKYIIVLALSVNAFNGTLPSWTKWKWPYHLTIGPQLGNVTGTISPFTNAICPTLDRLFLSNWNLKGTMPSLPPQYELGDGASIELHGNTLSGTFPWKSLHHVAFLTFQDNKFEGNMILSSKLKSLIAVNISNNKFDGMLPCLIKNEQLQFLDARMNKFSSIATEKESDCIAWPQTLHWLLLSDNKIDGVFQRMVRNLTNLSILDVGNNKLKGTVPSSVVEGTCNATYISFYDNDFSCLFPPGNDRKFKESWIYIGNGMRSPWAPYTNHWEKGLGIIAIAPKHEMRDYLVLPLIIGFICIALYFVAIKFKFLWINIEKPTEYKEKEPKDKILYIIQESVEFIGKLSIIAVVMGIFYSLGANFEDCGYQSLQPTVTYMGTQSGAGYDIYSFISVGLFWLYSCFCTWFVAKLMYLTKWFAKRPDSRQNIQNIKNRPFLRSSLNSLSSTVNTEQKMYPYSDQTEDQTLCFCAYWTVKFILFIVLLMILLFGPIAAYNIYHSIPYTNTIIPEINGPIFRNFIIYILPALLAIGKFFGIPLAIDQILSLLKEMGITHRQTHDNCRNVVIYCIRLITMIFLPIGILLCMDDGCQQNWKSLWNYCAVDDDGNFIHSQCEAISPKFPYLPGSSAWVCHGICNKNFVPYRCMRRFFEVLGPLYIYKMNIAMWFPLLYFIKQTEFGKSFTLKMETLWKKCKSCICLYCCCKSEHNEHGNNKRREYIKMDVEYMSLVSSLEIVFVFGWSVPILVILYGITIFGYWCVYSFWFNQSSDFINKKTLKPVTRWLVLSLILQHVLATCFYWYTQSQCHGLICIAIIVLNTIWFILLLFWYGLISIKC